MPVYAKRLGIDIAGQCEIDVPAGRSAARFIINDESFKDHSLEDKLCVDVTYFTYKKTNKVSLKHKSVCE